MNDEVAPINRGVLRTTIGDNERTDYLFRVSLKALIRNDRGEVLVVKEAGRQAWDLPGGGIDHGEPIRSALARELKEEVGYEGGFEYRLLTADDPHILEGLDVYQLRLIAEVWPDAQEFHVGEDCDEIRFINPEELRESAQAVERQVCHYAEVARNG